MYRLKVIKIDNNEIRSNVIMSPVLDFAINNTDNTIDVDITSVDTNTSVKLASIINTDNVLSCLEKIQDDIMSDPDFSDSITGSTIYYDQTVNRLMCFDDNIVDLADANKIVGSDLAIDMVLIPYTKYDWLCSKINHIDDNIHIITPDQC